jgi:hypothetical protein
MVADNVRRKITCGKEKAADRRDSALVDASGRIREIKPESLSVQISNMFGESRIN